jgi:AraC-like DNA-binding protein
VLEKIVLVIFFAHILMATFLFSLGTGNRLSHKLLAGYLLVGAFEISNFIFYDFYQTHLNLDMLRSNISLFIAPMLYGYVRAVIYNDFRLKAKYLAHAVPYVIACLVMLPNFFSVDNAGKQLWYDNLREVPELIFIHYMVFIQIGLYLLAILKHLNKYRKILAENYSDAEKLNTSWLSQLIFLFSLTYIIGLGRMFIRFSSYYQYEAPLLLMVLISFTLSICWILWQALHKPQLFVGISSTIEVVSDHHTTKESLSDFKVTAIETEENKAAMTQLKDYMQQGKPFLDPYLNIESLAEQINQPSSEVSFTINRNIGQHFFDFVNSYRINLAAEMLIDKDHQHKTILEILYEVGFNSKSSFYTAFKKHLKVTPSHYRKMHL